MDRLSIGGAIIGLVLISVFLTAPSRVIAQDQIVFDFNSTKIRDGLPAPWTFRRWAPMIGIGDYVAKAAVVTQNAKKVLHIESVKSGFIVGSKRDVDVSQYRYASWSWKATTLPTGGSFKQRSTNDQALQVLFGFDGGKVVSYVWDSTGRVGATGSGLAWREDVRVIVLQAGKAKLGQWVDERRDLQADFQKLFKAAPPTLRGVAIQSNSQHTDSTGEGYVGAISLSKS